MALPLYLPCPVQLSDTLCTFNLALLTRIGIFTRSLPLVPISKLYARELHASSVQIISYPHGSHPVNTLKNACCGRRQVRRTVGIYSHRDTADTGLKSSGRTLSLIRP